MYLKWQVPLIKLLYYQYQRIFKTYANVSYIQDQLIARTLYVMRPSKYNIAVCYVHITLCLLQSSSHPKAYPLSLITPLASVVRITFPCTGPIFHGLAK